MKVKFLLYAATFIVVAATSHAEDYCPGGQDVLVYFDKTDPEELTWEYVRSRKQLQSALTSPSHMIVVDVTHNPKNDNEPITFEDTPVDELLGSIIASITNDPDLRKGVKFNVKTKEALEGLIYKKTAQVSGFPLWLHVNLVNTAEQEDPSVFGIKQIYDDHPDEFNCYTLSFGWGSNPNCSPLSAADIQTMATKSAEIASCTKTFAIDLANLPQDITELNKIIGRDTLTLVVNDNNIKCSKPKTLQADLDRLKLAYPMKLFRDLSQSIRTHVRFCETNQKLKEYFVGEIGTDLTELKWKNLSNFQQLDEEYEEHVLIVNAKFLDYKVELLQNNFNDFMSKFMEKQKGKGLQINFRDQRTYDAFWNASVIDLEKVESIPIRVHVDIKTSNYNGAQLNFDMHRWLDCFELSAAVLSDADRYTAEDIAELREGTKDIAEKSYWLEMEKVLIDAAVVAPLLENPQDTLMVHTYYIPQPPNYWPVRDFVFKNFHRIYVSVPEQVKLFYSSDVVEFFGEQLPALKDQLRLLSWHEVVDSEAALNAALDEENANKHMMAVNVTVVGGEVVVESGVSTKATFTLKKCLEVMAEDGKHGIKIHFKTDAVLKITLEQKLLKFVTFPVWIRLDVIQGRQGPGNSLIKLDDHLNALKDIYHHYMLHCVDPYACEQYLERLVKEGEKLDGKSKTYPIYAGYVTEHVYLIYQQIYEYKKNSNMLIYKTDDDFINMAELRESVKSWTPEYYADVPNRVIFEECPKNQHIQYFGKEITNDYSNLNFSKPVKDVDGLLEAISNYKLHMIRAVVVEDSGVAHIEGGDGFTVADFLKAFKENVGDKKKGIVLSFPETKDFEIAMGIEDLRTLAIPIWFDVDILTTSDSEPIVQVNYPKHNDVIHCRQMVLGWKLDENFVKYTWQNIDDMQSIDLGTQQRIYKIHAEYLADSWEVLKDHNLLLTLGEDTNIITKDLRNVVGQSSLMYMNFPESRLKILRGCPSNQDAVSYFNISNDLTSLEFSEYVTSATELKAVIEKASSSNLMIRANVVLKDGQLYIHDPSSGFTLTEFFKTVADHVTRGKLGIVFHFSTTEVFVKATELDALKDFSVSIWFDMEVAEGPGGSSDVVQVDYLKLNDVIDCRTFALGWKTSGNFKNYTAGDVERMKNLRLGNGKKIYTVRAEYLQANLGVLEGLFENGNKFLSVFPAIDADDFITKDFREFREDQKQNGYFDLPEQKRYVLDECLGSDKQDVFEFFDNLKGLDEDLSVLNISRPVSSKEDVKLADAEGRHMISAVVHFKKNKLTIGNSAKFHLMLLLQTVMSYYELGLRLHFADTATFDAAMKDARVYDLLRTMKRPVWFSANVLGDGAVDLKYMKHNHVLDCRTLSLGWGVSGDEKEKKYTKEQIEEMRDAALGTAARTYLVNAAYLQNSWEDLNEQLLSGEGENNTITLWAEQSELENIDFVQLNKFLEEHKDKIFRDMPVGDVGDGGGGGEKIHGINVLLVLSIQVY